MPSLHDQLTQREELFCLYWELLGNPFEAAAKAGYPPHKRRKTALRLMKSPAIQTIMQEIRDLPKDTISAKVGLLRLAFGSANDAARLLFCEEEVPPDLEEMDLYLVSAMKRTKQGMEIKLHDRMQALEKLAQLESDSNADNTAQFYEAIQLGAEALGENDDAKPAAL